MIKIENTIISKTSPIYTIAEIGVNHNGSINNAVKMIDLAKNAGFDAVKFQTFIADEVVISNSPLANYQKKTKYKNQKSMLDKYTLSFTQFEK